MDELVNALRQIENYIAGSGITLALEGERVRVAKPDTVNWLRVVRLYRPTSAEVIAAAAADTVLVMKAATTKAAAAAASFNHIVLPDGSFRLVAPGLAVFREAPPPASKEQRRAKLSGRSGIAAETLLLGGKRHWSIRELAQDATVTKSLTHRVLERLESENVVESSGAGPEKTRFLREADALAELWSQEERRPTPFVRGYLFGATPEAIAQKLLVACPLAAASGVLAANLHHPYLTKPPYPLRFWVPEAFQPETLQKAGFEVTDEGPNIELMKAKGDPWQVHLSNPGIPRVSAWRAWIEIAGSTGRVGELADALFAELKAGDAWN